MGDGEGDAPASTGVPASRVSALRRVWVAGLDRCFVDSRCVRLVTGGAIVRSIGFERQVRSKAQRGSEEICYCVGAIDAAGNDQP